MNINISGRLPAGMTVGRVRDAVLDTFKTARRVPRGSIAIRFVGEGEIADLNRYVTGKKQPTDVLAFPSAKSAPGEHEWGDLFVATAYAAKQAHTRGIPRAEELIRLLAHGTLHLLGYDHRTAAEETRMFGLQERVVRNQ